MAATAQPSAAAAASAPPPAPPTLARAEGVELLGPLDGSGFRDGAALVRRGDGQVLRLGALQYGLLACLDGQRDPDGLAAALTERLGRRVERVHVERLARKLAAQGLLAGTEHVAPPRANPLLALRFKVLLSDPDVTRRITRPFAVLFRPWLLWPIVAGFVATAAYVLAVKGVTSATRDAFDDPEKILLVFGLGVASAAFHEIGHAAAASYGGARPGGMGAGIYLVWPAFYTDVTDAYRLPRRDRLRVDLGGLHFNAVVAVVTMAAWLVLRMDALLLLIGLQLLQMVKQLAPVIRADGYHVLADLTGVPDLYQHIGPTLRRLVPGRPAPPSALTGRARVVVTAWVLVTVPLLAALALGALLLLPTLLATAWTSGERFVTALPGQVGGGDVAGALVSVLRLVALTLPVLGGVMLAQRVARGLSRAAWRWSDGRPPRRAAVVAAGAGLAALATWALWPAGQYEPIRARAGGTVLDLGRLVAQPASVARPGPTGPAPVRLAPGRHLAVAFVPRGGASSKRPAFLVVPGKDGGRSVAIVTDRAPKVTAPPAGRAPAANAPTTAGAAAAGAPTAPAATTTAPPPAADATARPAGPRAAAAIPFDLPGAPRAGDSQALAVGTKDGGVVYDIAYAVVTVADGAPVTNANSAFALASCKACTTVAVSFQVVLVVGQSDRIAPINVAGALNEDCPACLTTAIATQLVVSLDAPPSPELLARLRERLKDLDGLPELGAGADPAEVLRRVEDVRRAITQDLDAVRPADKDEPQATSTTRTAPATATTTTSAAAPPSTTPTTGTAPAEPAPATSTAPAEPAPAPTTSTPAPTSTAPPATTTTPTAPTSTTPPPTTTAPTSTAPATSTAP